MKYFIIIFILSTSCASEPDFGKTINENAPIFGTWENCIEGSINKITFEPYSENSIYATYTDISSNCLFGDYVLILYFKVQFYHSHSLTKLILAPNKISIKPLSQDGVNFLNTNLICNQNWV